MAETVEQVNRKHITPETLFEYGFENGLEWEWDEVISKSCIARILNVYHIAVTLTGFNTQGRWELPYHQKMDHRRFSGRTIHTYPRFTRGDCSAFKNHN